MSNRHPFLLALESIIPPFETSAASLIPPRPSSTCISSTSYAPMELLSSLFAVMVGPSDDVDDACHSRPSLPPSRGGMHLVLYASLLSIALFVVLLPAFEAIFGPIDHSSIEDETSSSSSSCPSRVASHCDDDDIDDIDECWGDTFQTNGGSIELTFLHPRTLNYSPPIGMRRDRGPRGMDTIEEGTEEDEGEVDDE